MMKNNLKLLLALLAGILFGLGLTVSQMVNPEKVKNFLDIFGNWDPSLAFVMLGALVIFGMGFLLLIRGRTHSLFGDRINQKSNHSLTPSLFVGAIIFGLGWGITGLCPGPAIANLSTGNIKIVVFIIVMILGMKTSEWCKIKLASVIN